ncbi:hypothetical protein [Planosporangium flavigriseum]|uniref:Uncharacterized protein n=1 Tax=Planosporangium flavigriseum TaxID=373681 RepID=A0A8J3LH37_9ACTN|nr:hypothetical protein Pfl04_16120 [Planosporangium flavigriseum]
MFARAGVQVADVDASLAFYLRVFAPLWMREAMRIPHDGSFVVGITGPDGVPGFWLGPATGPETRELHVPSAPATARPSRLFTQQL